MNIRALLSKLIFGLTALTASLQVRATPIASYSNLYASFVSGAESWQFTYGANENFGPPTSSWDVTPLTIDMFSNSVWGSTYILNAANTAAFGAFTDLLTDGEEDWIGHRLTADNGGWASSFSSEPNIIFSAASGPFGADLIGYNITEITISFVQDHTFDFLNWPVTGKYTVSFFGSLASVPDTGSVLGLLSLGLVGLGLLRRRAHA